MPSTVFRGEVIGYNPRNGGIAATINFEVKERIRGEMPDRLTISWHHWTFGTPATWSRPRNLIVAADGIPEFPVFRILQKPCSLPFLLDDTEENRDKVRRLVKQ